MQRKGDRVTGREEKECNERREWGREEEREGGYSEGERRGEKGR